MSIEGHRSARGFFRDRLVDAIRRQGIQVQEATEWYLVNLMSSVTGDAFKRPLAHRLADALETEDADERFRHFRELGDAALCLCGLFSEHVDRAGITRDYVVHMGGRGYANASDLAGAVRGSDLDFAEIYRELARNFNSFAHAFDDVREATALRTPQDIVKLYDRWRQTRSPILAERLREEGVYPQNPGKPRIH